MEHLQTGFLKLLNEVNKKGLHYTFFFLISPDVFVNMFLHLIFSC